MDKLVRSPEPTPEECVLLEGLAREVDTFVRRLWREDEWETAWFVNPPVSRYHLRGCEMWLMGRGFGSDCKVCRAWRIYMCSQNASLLRRSQRGRLRRGSDSLEYGHLAPNLDRHRLDIT